MPLNVNIKIVRRSAGVKRFYFFTSSQNFQNSLNSNALKYLNSLNSLNSLNFLNSLNSQKQKGVDSLVIADID